MGNGNLKKVLITGGAGFIGSSLSIELVLKGYYVTVIDNMSPQIHGGDYRQSVLFQKIQGIIEFVKGDVLDKYIMTKLIQSHDAIIHLAAETGTGQSMYQIHKYTDVNVNGTSLLLDIIANEENVNIKKLIIASSRAIYGEGAYVFYNKRFDKYVHKVADDLIQPLSAEWRKHIFNFVTKKHKNS